MLKKYLLIYVFLSTILLFSEDNGKWLDYNNYPLLDTGIVIEEKGYHTLISVPYKNEKKVIEFGPVVSVTLSGDKTMVAIIGGTDIIGGISIIDLETLTILYQANAEYCTFLWDNQKIPFYKVWLIGSGYAIYEKVVFSRNGIFRTGKYSIGGYHIDYNNGPLCEIYDLEKYKFDYFFFEQMKDIIIKLKVEYLLINEDISSIKFSDLIKSKSEIQSVYNKSISIINSEKIDLFGRIEYFNTIFPCIDYFSKNGILTIIQRENMITDCIKLLNIERVQLDWLK